MKTLKKQIIIVSIFIGLGTFNSLGIANQKSSNVDEEIWQLEEKYWDFWIKEDLEGYLSLLHEDSLVWASTLEVPGDKKTAKEFVQNFWKQIKLSAVEIKPAGITIVGEVALVHYFLTLKDEKGNQVGTRYRITHTWKKQGGNWQLIGGMSSET